MNDVADVATNKRLSKRSIFKGLGLYPEVKIKTHPKQK